MSTNQKKAPTKFIVSAFSFCGPNGALTCGALIMRILRFIIYCNRYHTKFLSNQTNVELKHSSIMMGEQMKKGKITEISSYAQLKVIVNVCI